MTIEQMLNGLHSKASHTTPKQAGKAPKHNKT